MTQQPSLDPAFNTAPEHISSVHLMGIGGVAMGALAGALKRRGLMVRGSDQPLYPPMSTFLEGLSIPVAQGYAAQNLQPRPDLVIVGNVIRRDNTEAIALAQAGIPYLSLPQALARFFIRERVSIVVAGTHGKTTTTAIAASALMRGGLDPGFLVGGIMLEGGQNFADGAGPHFVVEGDEYDTAFFDKRPKFVHYRPRIAILTSCEFDHADIYADMQAVRRAFDLLVGALPPDGVILAWGDSPEVLARVAGAPCPVLTYGQGQDCAWRLVSARPATKGGAQLLVRTPTGLDLDFFSPLAGEHNALNTTAACAALVAAGLEPSRAAALQAGFGGVRRRQEVRGEAGGVVVVDDFAHHPTAVKETVAAVRLFGLPGWRPGQGRLVAVFEPRTNTSKRAFFQAEYALAFDRADLVFLREPPGVQDLPPDERFSSARLAADLETRGVPARAYEDSETLLMALLTELRPGDLCLVMSNGGFDNLHARLLASLGGA
ncbi:MAG: UDP-N-acetylmuramate:L-alanyl-gamma-D-glutamyl-meso-diaminopimelate ligase [Desulfarculus sp.]|nr:UDP-N-acetylmuramate:L-alanyl-gamma-D-glutamyl-meso-diaminopimelate ligase [Desulfarculus sp.]